MKRWTASWFAGGLAILLLVAAMLLDPTAVAASFHDATDGAGARLLRIMLVVLAGSIVAAVLFIRPAPTDEVDRGWPELDRRILLGIMLLGALARLPRLNESLWYDEIAAWRDYVVHGPSTIVGTYFDPANHIFHSLLTWLSAELIGATELGLRLPAFIASLLTVPAVYALSSAAHSRRIALIAAGIAAVAPVFVLEGVESRGYSIMILASAVTSSLLLANLRNERRWRWFAYAGIAGLGIWAHLMTVWIVIGHASWLALLVAGRRRDVGLRGLGTIALAAVWTMTLYAPVLPAILRIRESFGGRADTPTVLGIEGWHTALQFGGSWYAWAAAPGIALGLLGLATALRAPSGGNMPSPRGSVALTLLGLPIMMGLLHVLDSWMYARFALFMLPGAAMTIAIGLDAAWRRRRPAAIAAGVILLAAWTADGVVRPAKQPLREAAWFVTERAEEDEPVLVIGLRHEVLRAYAGPWEMRFARDHGADLDSAMLAAPVRLAVISYPKKVPTEVSARLHAEGFRPLATWPGWLDWGHGDVEVWGR